jgi:hypothetical protein
MTDIEQKALLDAENKGAEYERAAIVAWLRLLAFVTLRDDLAFANEYTSALEQSANIIERGEYWNSPPTLPILSGAASI